MKNIELLGCDLLAAANKYGLDKLKVLCEEELTKGFSLNKIGEMLILADRYKPLWASAIKFLVSNAKEVIHTDKFKNDVKSISPLFLGALKAVLNI